MSKLKAVMFAVAVTVATLVPAASAVAVPLGSNHNETLLLDT